MRHHIIKKKSRNGVNDHKGRENLDYTKVMYEKMFYDHNMTLTPVVLKIQLTLVISILLMSNNRLSGSENLVPA